MCKFKVGSEANLWENKMNDQMIKSLNHSANTIHLSDEDKKALDEVLKHDTTDKASVDKTPKPAGTADPVVALDTEDTESAKPFDLINGIRNSKGNVQVSKLLDFAKNISELSDNNLRIARNFLISLMSEPNNKDDELLGSLLIRVNSESDERLTRPKVVPESENGNIW